MATYSNLNITRLPLSLCAEKFVEIPRSLGYSQLCVWPAGGEKPPKSFAWLTGAGIYYGQLDFTDPDQVFVEPRLISYPSNRTVRVMYGCTYASFTAR